MPDTGAPYFIPFADPTDLVRDWPALSEDVAEAVADGLDEAGSAGIGSNVVQTVKTDVFSAALAAGATTALTGISATITPSSATAKVLVQVSVTITSSTQSLARGANIILKRNGTPIAVGDANGSRTRVTSGVVAGAGTALGLVSFTFLDEPTSASPVVYSVDGHQADQDGTRTLFVNRPAGDADLTSFSRAASSITLIEVAA